LLRNIGYIRKDAANEIIVDEVEGELKILFSLLNVNGAGNVLQNGEANSDCGDLTLFFNK
tara:strand:- start:5300 stop:5479 length:180 start_codon:yes stop_codon:yes gene_type:complete